MHGAAQRRRSAYQPGRAASLARRVCPLHAFALMAVSISISLHGALAPCFMAQEWSKRWRGKTLRIKNPKTGNTLEVQASRRWGGDEGGTPPSMQLSVHQRAPMCASTRTNSALQCALCDTPTQCRTGLARAHPCPTRPGPAPFHPRKVLDTCADSDCDGCCTTNARKNGGVLIDLESATAERFWEGEVQDLAAIEWQVV